MHRNSIYPSALVELQIFRWSYFWICPNFDIISIISQYSKFSVPQKIPHMDKVPKSKRWNLKFLGDSCYLLNLQCQVLSSPLYTLNGCKPVWCIYMFFCFSIQQKIQKALTTRWPLQLLAEIRCSQPVSLKIYSSNFINVRPLSLATRQLHTPLQLIKLIALVIVSRERYKLDFVLLVVLRYILNFQMDLCY